jgi:ribosome maturation factor RimP
MRPAERLELISNFSQEIADQFGISIVDVKFGQEGKRRTLEVSIFRADPQVSLSDCEQLSRLIETALDEQAAAGEPIAEGAYMLIVQSPGIDRVLKTDREYRVFAGQKVVVQTKEKVQDLGVKFVAVLLLATPEEIKLAHPKPLQTKTSKTAKAASKGAAKSSSSPGAEQSEAGPETEHEDISLSRSIVSEVRLFAPDLHPKEK